MTLQSRLLGVFAQYPDPRIGIITTELVLSSITNTFSPFLSRPFSFHTNALSAQSSLKSPKYFTPLYGLLLAYDRASRLYPSHVPPVDFPENPAISCSEGLLPDALARILAHVYVGIIQTGWIASSDKRGMRGLLYEASSPHEVDWLSKDIPLDRHTLVDFLVPWIARNVAFVVKTLRRRNIPARVYDIISEWPYWTREFIADWAHATQPNLMRLTPSEAYALAREWHLRELDTPCCANVPGRVVYTFADGWTVQKLTTQDQMKAESAAMGHCVAGYYKRSREGHLEIFSLRDAEKRPIVTFEITPTQTGKMIAQAKTHRNMLPSTYELCARIVEAADALGWEHLHSAVVDSPEGPVRIGVFAGDLAKCPGDSRSYVRS